MQPWMCGLIIFGGMDPNTGNTFEVSVFDTAFTKGHCKNVWEAIGACPLTMAACPTQRFVESFEMPMMKQTP